MVQVRTVALEVLMAIVACGLLTLGTIPFLNANAPSSTQHRLKNLSFKELENVEVTRVREVPQAIRCSIYAGVRWTL
ncbi:MAG: hypothetical protein ABSF34_03625 [Verrucomicrobiota bacterium]